MPTVTNPLDLLFSNLAAIAPCEPLPEVIARRAPRSADALEPPRTSNGHDRHAFNAPPSSPR